MAKPKIAVQAWVVRGLCEKDFAGTLKAVKAMGYDGIEFAGFYGHGAKDVRKMVDDVGIEIAGAHVTPDLLTAEQLASTVEFHQTLGNKSLVVPWIANEYRESRQGWLKTAEMFNHIEAELRKTGMRTGYHNHNFEFKPVDGGPDTGWDILAKHTGPDFNMQLDTGNALHGDGNPVDFLTRYPGRAQTIHLKEYPDGLIGDGNVDWSAIFAELKKQNCTEWLIVEQEGPLYPPLEYIDRWLQKLRQHPGYLSL